MPEQLHQSFVVRSHFGLLISSQFYSRNLNDVRSGAIDAISMYIDQSKTTIKLYPWNMVEVQLSRQWCCTPPVRHCQCTQRKTNSLFSHWIFSQIASTMHISSDTYVSAWECTPQANTAIRTKSNNENKQIRRTQVKPSSRLINYSWTGCLAAWLLVCPSARPPTCPHPMETKQLCKHICCAPFESTNVYAARHIQIQIRSENQYTIEREIQFQC